MCIYVGWYSSTSQNKDSYLTVQILTQCQSTCIAGGSTVYETDFPSDFSLMSSDGVCCTLRQCYSLTFS